MNQEEDDKMKMKRRMKRKQREYKVDENWAMKSAYSPYCLSHITVDNMLVSDLSGKQVQLPS